MSDPFEILPVAILAGGLATRLGPIARTIPKSMMLVADQPFIAHQLCWLAREGVRQVVLCTGHLSEQVEEFVGDGSAFGLAVRYSRDGDRLLGTGGALRGALPLLGAAFMVVYGDSYLTAPLPPIAAAFLRSDLPAMMAVFKNDGEWDTSNAEFRQGRLIRYNKRDRTTDMRHIDYGISGLRADAIANRESDVSFDLGDALSDLCSDGRLGGLEVTQRFYEIGSPAGLAEMDRFLREKCSA